MGAGAKTVGRTCFIEISMCVAVPVGRTGKQGEELLIVGIQLRNVPDQLVLRRLSPFAVLLAAAHADVDDQCARLDTNRRIRDIDDAARRLHLRHRLRRKDRRPQVFQLLFPALDRRRLWRLWSAAVAVVVGIVFIAVLAKCVPVIVRNARMF